MNRAGPRVERVLVAAGAVCVCSAGHVQEPLEQEDG